MLVSKILNFSNIINGRSIEFSKNISNRNTLKVEKFSKPQAKMILLSPGLIGLSSHSLQSSTQCFDLKKILIVNWFKEVFK